MGVQQQTCVVDGYLSCNIVHFFIPFMLYTQPFFTHASGKKKLIQPEVREK